MKLDRDIWDLSWDEDNQSLKIIQIFGINSPLLTVNHLSVLETVWNNGQVLGWSSELSLKVTGILGQWITYWSPTFNVLLDHFQYRILDQK